MQDHPISRQKPHQPQNSNWEDDQLRSDKCLNGLKKGPSSSCIHPKVSSILDLYRLHFLAPMPSDIFKETTIPAGCKCENVARSIDRKDPLHCGGTSFRTLLTEDTSRCGRGEEWSQVCDGGKKRWDEDVTRFQNRWGHKRRNEWTVSYSQSSIGMKLQYPWYQLNETEEIHKCRAPWLAQMLFHRRTWDVLLHFHNRLFRFEQSGRLDRLIGPLHDN